MRPKQALISWAEPCVDDFTEQAGRMPDLLSKQKTDRKNSCAITHFSWTFDCPINELLKCIPGTGSTQSMFDKRPGQQIARILTDPHSRDPQTQTRNILRDKESLYDVCQYTSFNKSTCAWLGLRAKNARASKLNSRKSSLPVQSSPYMGLLQRLHNSM